VSSRRNSVAAMADDELVHVAVDAELATITLASPANRNALSTRLIADLHRALDVADAAVTAGTARAIVLDHVPPAFCAGADLKERRTGAPDSTPMVAAMKRLMDAEVPTIAAVNGPARAGGVGLMACCDLVVVRSDLTFAFTEVRIGVAAAIISVPILRRVNGNHLAAAFLTGEPFDARFARDVGLVTHVTADVDATVAALVAGIRMGAPRAVAESKRMLRVVPTLERDEAFERMRALSDELFASPDAAEGMAAFAEQRPPRWQPPAG
jgi:methylglutaconyl-CoA hydratase